jgi:hypothetical protein
MLGLELFFGPFIYSMMHNFVVNVLHLPDNGGNNNPDRPHIYSKFARAIDQLYLQCPLNGREVVLGDYGIASPSSANVTSSLWIDRTTTGTVLCIMLLILLSIVSFVVCLNFPLFIPKNPEEVPID